jgi:hypothetical protein
VYGSHAEISYNSNVINSRIFCGANGGGAQTILISAATACDPGFNYSDVRIGTSWYPLPGFRLGAEVGYVMIGTAFGGQTITLTKTVGGRPTGAYVAQDRNIFVVALRANRGFGAVGGE